MRSPPRRRRRARCAAVAAAREGGFGERMLVARANGLDTEWGEADLAALAGAGFAAILVPKVASAADVARYAARIGDAELWIMIETCGSLFALEPIAAMAALDAADDDGARHQRSRQGDARAAAARPRARSCRSSASRSPRRVCTGSTCSTASTTRSTMPRGSGRLCAERRIWLRRAHADPPRPDRALQRRLHPRRGRGASRAGDRRGVRGAGECGQGRAARRRRDGGAAASRRGAPHDRDWLRPARGALTSAFVDPPSGEGGVAFRRRRP